MQRTNSCLWKTPFKDNPNILCERYIANDADIASVQDLQYLVNKVYVASVLCEYNVGANLGAQVDSCIKRYCNWSDSEREDFILRLCKGLTDSREIAHKRKWKTTLDPTTKKQKTVDISRLQTI